MIPDKQVCLDVAADLRRCGAHHLPISYGQAIFAACVLEKLAARIDHYEQLMFSDEFDMGAVAELEAVAASGMPLRENNEDCSRPKAGSPTAKGGDAQPPSGPSQ